RAAAPPRPTPRRALAEAMAVLAGQRSGDRAAALAAVRRAAEEGLPGADFALGRALEEGLAGDADAEGARAAYRRGAERGDPRCMFALARRLLEDGKPATMAEGVAWLERYAEARPRAAEVRRSLGDLFAHEGARWSDPAKARRYWREAYELGSTVAALRLADAARGQGREADARRWLERAARAGDGEAHFALAEAYEQGALGLRASRRRALQHYRAAAAAGHPRARERAAALEEPRRRRRRRSQG
ncbi:MAG: sel1 repeat family protein, partial [Planctomycetota bacterium]